MKLHVECYAGHRADQRPRLFFLEDRKFEVKALLDTWYGPDDEYFRVLADDGNTYILRHKHAEPEDVWTLEAFRKTADQIAAIDPGTDA